MSKHFEIINKINLEYYNLIYNHIKGDEIYQPEFPAHKIWPKVFDESAIVLKSPFGLLTSIQYKAIRLLYEIYDFWKKNMNEYTNAIGKLEVSKSYQTSFNKNSTLFFDTIILRHSIFFQAKISFEFQMVQPKQTTSEAIRLVRDIVPLFPFLKTNHPKPLLAFDVWGDFNTNRKTDLYGQSIELNTWERVHLNINSIIQSIAKPDFKKYTFNELNQLSMSKEIIDINDILDSNSLISFLEARKFAKGHLIASDWNSFMDKSTTKVPSDVFGFLIQSLSSCVIDLDFQDDGCTFFKAEPIIEFFELYKLRLSIESARTLQAIGLSQEYGIAQSISLPAFDWIKEMTNDDIIHFRENDGANYLRDIFNEQKNQIKYASIDDFKSISERAKEKLIEVIKEENLRIKLDQQKLKKDLVKTSLSFGFTITIGVVSIAAPPLLAIAIPSAIIATIIGSSSAKDLIDTYLSNKKQDKLIRDRPIGILAKYIEI